MSDNDVVNDNRHCWFCDRITMGKYLTSDEWLCWVCGTVEDLADWPTKDHAAFRHQITTALNDREFLDRLATHLQSPQWREPLANPRPALTELHSADLHDGFYDDGDDT